MSVRTVPQIDCEQQHPGLAVTDVRAAVAYYTEKLGFKLGFTWGDPPSFAGVTLDRVQLFLEQGTPSPDGCAVYFMVGDADELFEFHRANGVTVIVPPENREYGLRDYSVRDLHGYRLTFGHPTFDTGEKMEIERVDLPVRLEKRLAAVLRDLAEYKHMSLDSCLEETLLHTFEPLGDGVASPHTKSQLRHIQTLKKKHGMDYDSHASYRFVER